MSATNENAIEQFAAWTPIGAFNASIHGERMTALSTLVSSRAASAYVRTLVSAIPVRAVRDDYTFYPRRAAEILDVARAVATWNESPSTAPFRRYVLLEAVYAALELFEYEAVRHFHELATMHPGPLEIFGVGKVQAKYRFPNEQSAEHAHLLNVLSRKADSDRAALLERAAEARAEGKPLRDMSDIELGWLAGRAIRTRLLDDPQTGQIWAHDMERGFLYFDGYAFCVAPFQYEGDAPDDRAYVAAVCDSRVSLWRGKTKYHLIHRYGNAVRWNPGKILPDSHTVMYTHWIVCADEAQAIEVARTIERSVGVKYKRESSWKLAKKRGVIMREYSSSWQRIGIHGAQWVQGIVEVELIKEFENEAEAIRAFEEAELARLREGETLKSVRVETRWEDGRLLEPG